MEVPIDSKLSMAVIVQSHRPKAALKTWMWVEAILLHGLLLVFCYIAGREDEATARLKLLGEGETCPHWWVSGICQSEITAIQSDTQAGCLRLHWCSLVLKRNSNQDKRS